LKWAWALVGGPPLSVTRQGVYVILSALEKQQEAEDITPKELSSLWTTTSTIVSRKPLVVLRPSLPG
jgi:hypothetical protein